MKAVTRLVLSVIAGIGTVLGMALWVDNRIYWKRPSSVPLSAVRQVGVGWNYWIDCTPTTDTQPNVCTIYQPRSGEILKRGPFILREKGRGALKAELQLDSWDGTSIRLKNGERLDPVSR
jgi:hypothetical protein